MLIHHDPDAYVTVHESHTCEHHKRQPWDTGYPGCTCSGSYSQRLATTEERAENIRRRKAEEQRRRQHMADYDAGKLK
jgi:hypothetical protein